MKFCEKESALLAAVGNGHWTEDLRRHVQTCESCRSTIALLPKIRSLAETSEKMAVLPDYRWVMVQSEIYMQESKRRFIGKVSGFISGSSIIAFAIGLTWLFGTSEFSPIDIFTHLKNLNWSVLILLMILWLVSEFQFHFLFKPKTKKETV